MQEIVYKLIGIIHTPFKDKKGVPKKPTAGKNVKGRIKMGSEYVDGLKGVEGFSHVILVYHFHRSVGYSLHVKQFISNRSCGVFATRSPKRPNPIGISVVKLVKIKGGTIYIRNVDMMDGTPLLDIKPLTQNDS